MRTVPIVISFLIIACQQKAAQPADKMELMKAYEANKVVLVFTGKDNGGSIDLTVKNNSKQPLTIVVPKDTMRFDLTALVISIVSSEKTEFTLSNDGERTLSFPQSGETRFRSGSITTM
jgi:hypothetical protein